MGQMRFYCLMIPLWMITGASPQEIAETLADKIMAEKIL